MADGQLLFLVLPASSRLVSVVVISSGGRVTPPSGVQEVGRGGTFFFSTQQKTAAALASRDRCAVLAGLLLVGDDLLVAHSGHDRHALPKQTKNRVRK